MQESRLVATLRKLYESDIQFIVVGGLAAVLNGAPVQTFDVDLVYSREPANVDRLMHFLRDIDAIFRIQQERRLRPAGSHLAAGGHVNLLTRYGPIDLLATIGQNLNFSDLLPHSNEMDIGDGIRVRVLNLETLISVKEQLASEKDVAMLHKSGATGVKLSVLPGLFCRSCISCAATAGPRLALKGNLPAGLDNDTCAAHILYVPHMERVISGWRGI